MKRDRGKRGVGMERAACAFFIVVYVTRRGPIPGYRVNSAGDARADRQ